jgi:hypothetical protein
MGIVLHEWTASSQVSPADIIGVLPLRAVAGGALGHKARIGHPNQNQAIQAQWLSSGRHLPRNADVFCEQRRLRS